MNFLRRWSVTLVTAAVTATVLVVVMLLAGAGEERRARAATDSSDTPSRPPAQASGNAAGTTANTGPEDVPMPGGVPLGPAGSPRKGKSLGGIPCGSGEQFTYHVHARLTLFVNGKPRSIPLGVGIGRPRDITNSDKGAFASGGSCFSFLHTHAADGVIHIEAPGPVPFKLGQFFDVWGQRLDRNHLGGAHGRVVAYVNGDRFRGDPRAIPLKKHSQIQLEVGQPHVSPALIKFPGGL